MKIKDIYNGLAGNVVDSTAIVTTMNPVMSLFETNLAGMSNELSMNARILGTALTYFGLGIAYSKCRDLSRKIFKITADVSEKTKHFHDALYSLVYALTTTPLFYYAAGSRDVREIALGTITTLGIGTVMGGPMGYAIDSYRDLTGIQESERLPDLIKRQMPFLKKTLAALLTAGSVVAVAGVYSFNNYVR